eukprot:GHVS01000208.1.p1 GENE.GHVS01000208.1~~GHVS01000208.1.p1  ORF type:complete len:286 (+),score=38.18 GHVS01000208.1:199-1056(+)
MKRYCAQYVILGIAVLLVVASPVASDPFMGMLLNWGDNSVFVVESLTQTNIFTLEVGEKVKPMDACTEARVENVTTANIQLLGDDSWTKHPKEFAECVKIMLKKKSIDIAVSDRQLKSFTDKKSLIQIIKTISDNKENVASQQEYSAMFGDVAPKFSASLSLTISGKNVSISGEIGGEVISHQHKGGKQKTRAIVIQAVFDLLKKGALKKKEDLVFVMTVDENVPYGALDKIAANMISSNNGVVFKKSMSTSTAITPITPRSTAITNNTAITKVNGNNSKSGGPT